MRRLRSLSTVSLLFSLVAGLSACGGGGSSGGSPSPAPSGNESPAPAPSPSPSPAPGQTAPGGLYIGHYQEDPGNNPEDPMPGSFYLVLPEGNDHFSGEMSFTYFGCQSSNVGTVSGLKNDWVLSGEWSGTVDNLFQSGDYSGTYDAAQQRYSGTYTNHAGKQHRDLSPCVVYDIAAFGTWEMSPVEARKPADFAITLANNTVNWAALGGVSWWLASVYDEAKALAGGASGAAVTRQTFLPAGTHTLPVAALGLTAGRRYILAISGFDASYKAVAYTSLRYTAP